MTTMLAGLGIGIALVLLLLAWVLAGFDDRLQHIREWEW